MHIHVIDSQFGQIALQSVMLRNGKPFVISPAQSLYSPFHLGICVIDSQYGQLDLQRVSFVSICGETSSCF